MTGAALSLSMAFVAPAAGQVMMLPGQFDVSPTGSALYTVPIEVPPGTAGMSPALTLDYDSGAGNGLLGVGWNLGGLPSIGRCPRTVAQDSVRGLVDFTANDRFCMDGQRLVVITGTYGAANSEYRTEIEGFTKIVAYGTAGNGPAYFKAWTKSGQIIEFGNTTDSRILAKGTTTARSWAANKISDTKGNYLTVTYTNDATNGQAYPLRIDYTGNASANLTPYNSVRFEYDTEPRPDVVPVYIAGAMIKNTVRLKRITTYEGPSTVVKAYELVYDTGSSTARSRITSIKICDGNGMGANCLPATSFSLSTASLSFPQISTNPISTADMGTSVVLYLGDWNGDGVTDAMTWNPSNGTNKWFVNNGSLSFTTYTNKITASQITSTASIMYLGDWNGDGITDIMWWKPADGTNRWFVNNGSLTFTQTNNAVTTTQISGSTTALDFGDWNGDAITDFMWRTTVGSAGSHWFINNGSLSFSQTNSPITIARWWEEDVGEDTIARIQFADLTFADWDGDGITDVLRYFGPNPEEGVECNWLRNDGALNFTSKATTPCFSPTTIYGDWNGDGLLDAVLYSSNTGSNTWYLNEGDFGFSSIANPITPSTITGGAWLMHAGDWNMDGMTDVMVHMYSSGSNRWFTTSWSETGVLQFDYVSNLISTSSLTGTGGVLAFGDWSGDGFDDLMFRLPSAGTNRWFYKSGTMRPDVLVTVTTGLGSDTDITYKPLTDASVYTKETNAAYPVIDIKAPFYVVSRVDADNGIGGDYSSTYSYTGAKIDLTGRGFLGFHKQVVTDLQTSVAQTLTFRQDYPFIGFVSEDKKVRSSVVLNDRDNTYAATNLGGTRRFPYLSQVTEASKDLDATSFPTVTSSYTYDSYGNPLTVTVSTPDGASRVTTNTYSNNTTSWLLGRLLSSTVASTTPDVTPTPTGCQTSCVGDMIALSIDSVAVTEGGSLVFTVTRTGSSSPAVDVDYATADGTGVGGSDYTAVSGTLAFATSETTKTVTVVTTADSVFEGDETVLLNLSNATAGVTITQGQGIGTITEDDATPSFSIGSVSIAEGGVLSFTVTKSGATALSHAVNYATADDTAASSDDYTATSGTVTFAAGETAKSVSVTTVNDNVYENSETVLVNLSGATSGATITQAQGVGTITNNDAAPTFTINNAANEEGLGITFTITKSGATALSHQVSYATANGAAIAGSDYTAKSGTLTFNSSDTTKTVTVSTTEDSSVESNETFYLNLSSATNGATISDSQGVGTINNDDFTPSFSISNANSEEGYNLVFTVTRSGSTAGTNSVTVTSANGTATAPSDYGSWSGALTFTAGQATKTVSTFLPYGSNNEPFEETMYMNLSNPTGGATISDSQGVGTITNVPVCGGVPC
ncbi:MAG: Calx-beta domain-containing protein [Parvularculaceae bacterium]